MADSPLPKWEKESVIRGDTRVWNEQINENTAAEGETPVYEPMNLTGWTWLCQIRADLNRGTVIANLDIDDTDAADGKLIRTLPSDQADLLPGQTEPDQKPLVYMDLQGTRTSDGFRQTFKRWKVTVEGDSSDE